MGGLRPHASYVCLEEAAESMFGMDNLGAVRDLTHLLLEYDRDAKQTAFEKGTYECGVFIGPKKGNLCHEIKDCGHIF